MIDGFLNVPCSPINISKGERFLLCVCDFLLLILLSTNTHRHNCFLFRFFLSLFFIAFFFHVQCGHFLRVVSSRLRQQGPAVGITVGHDEHTQLFEDDTKGKAQENGFLYFSRTPGLHHTAAHTLMIGEARNTAALAH